MMEAFPVQVVPHAAGVVRNASGKACPHDSVWYRDWHAQLRPRGKHEAQDIFAPEGSFVRAPAEGLVVRSTRGGAPTAVGGHSITLHDTINRRTYYFAHLRDAPLVGAGDRVRLGQLLGVVGRTGNAAHTCPHLHLQVKVRTAIGGRWRPVNVYQELRQLDPTRPRKSRGETSKSPKGI